MHTFFEQWQSVSNVYEACAKKAGISALQLRLLDIVEQTPACTQTALCGQLRLSKQHVSALLQKLYAKGLLKTQKDGADGRKKPICLTEQGKAFAGPVLAEVRGCAAAALEKAAPHVHIRADGTVTEHAHGPEHTHGHGHTHTHTHQNTKAVLDRLARAIGHMEKVRRMVEDGVDCSEVLIQLAAVKAAVNNTGKLILKDHIEHCLVDAVEHGDSATVDELNRAIDQFIK